jgi:DNA topoisomerase-2
VGLWRASIQVNNRKKREIEGDLMQQGFDEMTKTKAGLPGAAAAAPVDEDAAEDAGEMADVAQSAGGKGYDYLLSMPIFSLTLEKVQALCAERDGKQVRPTRVAGSAHSRTRGNA